MKGYSTIKVKSESADLIAKVILIRKRCQFSEIKEILVSIWTLVRSMAANNDETMSLRNS
jgi:hypothetical protein